MSATTSALEPALEVGLQRHFIGGEFREAIRGGTFETLNPVTNEPIGEAADGTAEDVDAAVTAARAAFDDGDWPRLPAAERARILRQIAGAIREHAEEFVALECRDIGMPISQMRGLAARAAENFDYFASAIEQLHGRSFQSGSAFLNYTVHKPAGVAALIMPWNAPLMLSTWRIAPCLAAGDTLVLKPAEWSPLTATRLAELIAATDLPAGVFNVVHGFGETAGAPLAAHRDVQLVCFTGEGATAEKIMAAGAPTLKRYSFELGGKSPVVVFADADFDRAVDAAVAQIFTLNGQRCTAGSRLLVERPLYDDLVAAVAERARHVRVGDPFDPRTELGPLITAEHHARVCSYIDAALADGAELLAGGARPEDRPDGNFLAATVLGGVRPGTRPFDEEIFGPVLVATPFAGEE
ncbi:MAG TPA: aldehyde dehydrogenase family protein, partial [Solirubrobacteraceae bacterium]|nr:aldehyde dehydrogenase family protein [Solirubrobacteraceae bacterium]